MARKKRKSGRKTSRKHAMPKMKRGRRRKGGRRRRNPEASPIIQLLIGGGGFMVAGAAGGAVSTSVMKNTDKKMEQLTRVGVAAAGTLGAMALGASNALKDNGSISGPLAAGMAASGGVGLLSYLVSMIAPTNANAIKFLGLAANPATSTAAATAATSTAATSTADTSSSLVSAGTLAVTHTPGGFLNAAGTNITAIPITTKKVTDSDGTVVDVEVWGAQVDGKTVTLTDGDGRVWIRNAKTGEFLVAPSSSLSGAYPPWAGYPSYNDPRFPQQVISPPASARPQVAPSSVNGYYNMTPSMSGYYNMEPSMNGWTPGFEG